jgi:cytochrome c oxidase cbb3-type subunit II
MADEYDKSKVGDPDKDPNVATVKDFPEEIPNELPHHSWMFKHHGKIERNAFLLLVLSLIVVSIGGIVQIVPLFYLDNTIEEVEGVRPYSPLELAGRNIYVREGCYVCHSQMIRVMRDEVERYGHYSLAAESMYDHPFQWGSKRTGPDLARVGGRYSDAWHVAHFENPRDLVPESIMPAYPWFARTPIGSEQIAQVMRAHRAAGVPYTDEMIAAAQADFRTQADPDNGDVDALLERYPKAVARNFDGEPGITELDAMIAYLQMLGTLVDFSTYTPVPSR